MIRCHYGTVGCRDTSDTTHECRVAPAFPPAPAGVKYGPERVYQSLIADTAGSTYARTMSEHPLSPLTDTLIDRVEGHRRASDSWYRQWRAERDACQRLAQRAGLKTMNTYGSGPRTSFDGELLPSMILEQAIGHLTAAREALADANKAREEMAEALRLARENRRAAA